MNALAANGAHVFGLASSLASARNACDQIGPRATPVECNLTDLDSVAAAAGPFSWEEAARRTVALYRELLEERT